ncbi:hypothetical protein A2276_00775 [candidate division WOR-1 bacterium RIFOXYA12_FULL_43_27]|uniref:Porin domain-containing protein n=1 Tax=candidate division WOR-1 bacterium RIFOXYC2_FULL_46_14 TaxID=1802587 RepID=A0A1F4U4S3_UNCSA|nr:MAG: hypothetical protein A2276_00775 [candidate division WOR-1 bacterium RIFOXYA12_FULL_43_27]OGC20779.1 MAG: hypothetical protein A2292_07100 [candidate division WOR-1 bacterium RIFOXYB2_FULL_46_45]OGC31484.1 MAG: hypothetical protein A2232_04350 [candidate division WOR-1 bacterium RIFOXYA2_FULL_46_56]OGC39891.1 MAG: hypothetical protein A2438_05190 [candidate division WOR-1 bacterium RIFOXYC2_FULL_46_14]
MLRKTLGLFLSLFLFSSLSYAVTYPAPYTSVTQPKSNQPVKIDLKPKEAKSAASNIAVLSGYTQVRFGMGGGNTSESFYLGPTIVRATGELSGGVTYRTEIDLQSVPTSGAVALGDVYIDVPNLIGQGNIFRFGRFPLPFGYDLWLSSSKKYDMTRAFYNTCFWDREDYGIQNYSRDAGGSYDLAIVNGQGSVVGASKSKDFVGRYIMKIKDAAELGISEYLGTYNGKNRGNFGAYFKSTQGMFTGIFEYANGTDKTGTNRTLDFYNIIVQNLSPQIENILVYESWDPNLDQEGDSILAYTFGMNYYKTKEIKFVANARLQKVETASDFSKSLLAMVQVEF